MRSSSARLAGLISPALLWCVCWACYGIGHVCSLVINMLPDQEGKFERSGEILYRAYQGCMTASVRLQDRFKVSRGPWSEA